MTGLLERAMNFIAEVLPMFGKTLWSGTAWSSGSKVIQDSDKYVAYIIVQNGNPILALRDGTMVNGFAITGNTTNATQYIRTFRATVSNETTWTLGWAKQLTHTASNNHNAGENHSITKVVGLIPSADIFGGGCRLTSLRRWLHDWVKRQDSEFLGGFRCKHRRRSSTRSRYSKLWSVQRYNRDFSQKLQICACCSSGVSLRFNSRNIRPMYSRCSLDNCDWLQDKSLQWRHGSKISGHSLDSYGTVTPGRGWAA